MICLTRVDKRDSSSLQRLPPSKEMRLLMLACLCLHRAAGGGGGGGGGTGGGAVNKCFTENENVELAKELQQDLRRQMDDYPLETATDRTTHGTAAQTATGSTEPAAGPDMPLHNRRGFETPVAHNSLRYIGSEPFHTITPRNSMQDTGTVATEHSEATERSKRHERAKRTERTGTGRTDPDRTHRNKSTSTRYPKYVNKHKMEKLLKFLDKNQDRVKEFMNMKTETTMAVDVLKSHHTKSVPRSGRGPRARARAQSDGGGDGSLPAAVQLDMSPAKGGRIHMLRIKDRLCNRHVLFPEGPKYDSLGRVYLSAHAGQRDFVRTRRPPILLPKCCNCCQKSLLGCE